MAMLAEPRQRKQYNLTPRGKALYEDDTRFGTKMLEKMGWSKGKGLGANEDGSQDFVRVRMRNTNEGLGFEDRDDHWTQHEQDFNGLLKTLNGDEAIEDKENTSDEDTPRVGFGFGPEPKKPKVEKLKDKISGISLEQKSKQSKARVHYQKFTKGKDIAQYSEKDLANIFGKKVVETEQADGVYAQLTAVIPKVNANFGGVQTISTGLSVSDYFKQKMEALKNNQNQNNNNRKNNNKNKYKKRKREIESVEAGDQTTELISLKEVEDNTVLEVQGKKEKHKKNKSSTEEIPTETIENLAIFKNDEKKNTDSATEIVDLTDEADKEDVQVPKNKKKKKKCKENEIEQHTNQNDFLAENKEEDILATEMPKKKKKSKKSKSDQSKEDDDVIIVGYEAPTSSDVPEPNSKLENVTKVGTDGHIKVKKNKKSKKRENSEENTEETSTPETSDTPYSKKSKKQKKSIEVLQASETSEQTTEKSKKSKKDVSEDNQALTLDELIAKCNSYNIYNISSFVAEKFRNVDLEQFKGSTITHIPGYTHTADLQLNVVNEPHDEERITRLWNCSEDKYVQINPKAIFGKYRQNVLNAYKTMQHTKNKEKKPLPLFNIKSLKRKSVFQPI